MVLEILPINESFSDFEQVSKTPTDKAAVSILDSIFHLEYLMIHSFLKPQQEINQKSANFASSR